MKMRGTERLAPVSKWSAMLGVLIVAYVIFFSAYQVRRYRAFWHEDIVSVEQPIWNTLHGRLMRATYYPMAGLPITSFEERRTESLLADHVQPFLLALLPAYALLPRTETLLVLMALAVSLGAIPMYRIARRRLPGEGWALAFAVVYLLMPAVQTNSVGDLHALRFLPPLLLAALDAAECGRIGWWWFWMILAAGTREDVAVFAGWAMVFLAPATRRRQAWIMFVAGVVYALLCFLVVIPFFGGGGTPYLTRFFPAGTPMTLSGMWQVVVRSSFWVHNLQSLVGHLIRLTLPVFFLCWFHRPSVLALAPVAALNGLSWFEVTLYPNLSHYSALAVPWVCLGAVEGFQRVSRLIQHWRPGLRGRWVVGEILLVSVAATQLMTGYTPVALNFAWPEVGPREALKEQVLSQMPEGEVVSAESHLGAHLARRETMRFFPDRRGAEWVALDFWTGHYFYLSAQATWRDMASDEHWETVMAQDGLLLLKRGDGPPDNIEEAFVPRASGPLQPLHAQFGKPSEGVVLLGLDVSLRANGHVVLCSEWQASGGDAFIAEVSLADAEFVRLDGLRFYPELFSQTQIVRDCTQLVALGSIRTHDVLLRVLDDEGSALSVNVLSSGAFDTSAVGASEDVLYVQVHP